MTNTTRQHTETVAQTLQNSTTYLLSDNSYPAVNKLNINLTIAIQPIQIIQKNNIHRTGNICLIYHKNNKFMYSFPLLQYKKATQV